MWASSARGHEEEALSLSVALSHLSIGHHRKSNFHITVYSRSQPSYKDRERYKCNEHSNKLHKSKDSRTFIERWLITSVLPAVGGYG